jgi:hypothetical protein
MRHCAAFAHRVIPHEHIGFLDDTNPAYMAAVVLKGLQLGECRVVSVRVPTPPICNWAKDR